MAYKGLYIFVEGIDDERFFKNIIVPGIKDKYDSVQIIKYAQESNDYIANYIKSIKSIGANYIFVTDINSSPCVTDRKEKIKNKYKNIDKERIIVVIKEIESWYLAGLNNTVCKKLGIRNYDVTDNITKEQFNMLIPKKFDSRIDFMIEILKNFSIKIAKQKNGAFKYLIDFIEKYV